VTVQFTHKDGRTVWTEYSINPVRDARGTVVAEALRDVLAILNSNRPLEARRAVCGGCA
jgi:regulator of RNase E activity RraA